MGFIVMVGNTPMVAKALTQTSVEKSTYRNEFVGCAYIIEVVLLIRDMLRCIGYRVDDASKIFL